MGIDPLNHIVWFNPKTLERILALSGFKDIVVESAGMLDLDFVLDAVKRRHSAGLMDHWFLDLGKKENFINFKKDFAALLRT